MASPKFSIVTWVNRPELYHDMVESFAHLDCEFITIGAECGSMAQAYNAGTDRAQGRYLVYCHQDARLLDAEFESKVEALFSRDDKLGLVGVAGADSNRQKSLWFAEGADSYRGKVFEDGHWVTFGDSDCEARTIDGFFMVTDKKFSFPEILPGVHFLDAWMCRQAEDAGLRNWVIDIDMAHLSKGETASRDYRNNLELYRFYWYGNPGTNHAARAFKARRLSDLSIVIAVYNNLQFTRPLLEQLRTEAFDAEIIVVNNASTDGTSAWLDAQSGIKVVHNATNEGVSRAWNKGLRLATRDVLSVLNNDVQVKEDGIVRLYEAAQTHGIACATAMRANRSLWGGQATHALPNSDYANGEALFFRRDVWQSVGEFDESYVLAYFEDTDWSCRARLRGHSWHHVPGAIVHFPGQTSRLVPEVAENFGKNFELFKKRYQHLGFSEHTAITVDTSLAQDATAVLKHAELLKTEKPLSRVYVFCPDAAKPLFASSRYIDYAGEPADTLDVDFWLKTERASHTSPLITAPQAQDPPRVLVGTMMCDRKQTSQMVSLRGIAELGYENFSVYINIQSDEPQAKFASVFEWAAEQEFRGTRVHIDTWTWTSSWCRDAEFDQDPARLAPICTARNMMLQAAASMGFDYLLQVDNDVIIPSNTITRLVQENRPVVGGVVPGRGAHGHLKYLFGHIENDGDKAVYEYTTCGFVLLRRDVFEYLRYRTGKCVKDNRQLSEDPAFFIDAANVWGFGHPLILTDLVAEHWDDPNAPLTHAGVVRDISVLRRDP
ncbi:MAG: glycosyltransferase family 2 protein [Armatimonadetes bacterium]|nr:glycosyltransferase family 2 protein [Armatimonadota bacterium]